MATVTRLLDCQFFSHRHPLSVVPPQILFARFPMRRCQSGRYAFIRLLKSFPWFGTSRCSNSWTITTSRKPDSIGGADGVMEGMDFGGAAGPEPIANDEVLN